ncbi:MAG: peptidoglycan DD-metalloendopeptidase family protein [Gammaproteobacteria bacterium]|nr:peptidoglycan DD-metalloendopeptidase family protein [Gammaproteobacteria bacterium]
MAHRLFQQNVMVLLFLMTGCMSAYQSPVADIDEPRFLDSDRIHRVNEGETLYAVAWIYNLDFLQMARVNNLASPYIIIPGQILNVDPRAQPVSQPPASSRQLPAGSPNTSSRVAQARPAPSSTRSSTTNDAPSPVQVNPVRVQQGPVSWGWPAQGSIIGRFSAAGVENKGIDIAGQKGESVVAAANGEVVYAGSGLLRYGDLVIIKHNDLFLSAYAHNSALLVSEGDRVSRGEKIAELGSTGIDQDMLHFEIRLEGSPVDPLEYLPPNS